MTKSKKKKAKKKAKKKTIKPVATGEPKLSAAVLEAMKDAEAASSKIEPEPEPIEPASKIIQSFDTDPIELIQGPPVFDPKVKPATGTSAKPPEPEPGPIEPASKIIQSFDADGGVEVQENTTPEKPTDTNKKLQFAFPSKARCPRCHVIDTVRTGVSRDGATQYRRCQRAVCRKRFSVTGQKI